MDFEWDAKIPIKGISFSDEDTVFIHLPRQNTFGISMIRVHKDRKNLGIAVSASLLVALSESIHLQRAFLWALGKPEIPISSKLSGNLLELYCYGRYQAVHTGPCIIRELAESKREAETEAAAEGVSRHRKTTLENIISANSLYREHYYILVYGKSHPLNHISRTYFANSIQASKRAAVDNYHANGYNWTAGYDVSKVKQESNTEPTLEAMNLDDRLRVLDGFIGKLEIARNFSNNTKRLKKYLTQCVMWYHGRQIPFWRTTAEYRHRWKRHVDWILSSPIKGENIQVGLKKPSGKYEVVNTVVLPASSYKTESEITYEIDKVRHEPTNAEFTVEKLTKPTFVAYKKGIDQKQPKFILTQISDCICGYPHAIRVPGSDDLVTSLRLTHQPHPIGTYHMSKGKRDNYPHPMHKKAFEVPKKVIKTKYQPVILPNDIKIENYYTMLSRDKSLDEPMPLFLSPLSADHSRDYPWTNVVRTGKDSKRSKKTAKNRDTVKAPKEKNSQRVIDVNTRHPFSDRAKRLINPRLQQPFACQTTYIRKIQGEPIRKLEDYLNQKGITKEKICRVVNQSIADASGNKEAKVHYTRSQKRLILDIFAFGGRSPWERTEREAISHLSLPG